MSEIIFFEISKLLNITGLPIEDKYPSLNGSSENKATLKPFGIDIFLFESMNGIQFFSTTIFFF